MSDSDGNHKQYSQIYTPKEKLNNMKTDFAIAIDIINKKKVAIYFNINFQILSSVRESIKEGKNKR